MHDKPRLITLPISHFSEKARWALQRAKVDFVEQACAPGFHRRVTRLYGGRTVPVLATSEGNYTDSTDILRWVDTKTPEAARLFPADPAVGAEVEALEELFDRKLGPRVRNLVYYHVLSSFSLLVPMWRQKTPFLQGLAVPLLFPLLVPVVRKGFKLSAEDEASARADIEGVFKEVERRLADGRRYLLGERFTAADLTFAALAAPALGTPGYNIDFPAPERLPIALRTLIETYRARPAGKFAWRVFTEDRRRTI